MAFHLAAGTSSWQWAISSSQALGTDPGDEDISWPALTKVGPRRSKARLTRRASMASKLARRRHNRSHVAPARIVKAAAATANRRPSESSPARPCLSVDLPEPDEPMLAVK